MSINGKNIVFTGTLMTMTRAEAEKKAEAHGAYVQRGIRTDTDILVVGDKPGSKLKNANMMGITIMDENEFRENVSLKLKVKKPIIEKPADPTELYEIPVRKLDID